MRIVIINGNPDEANTTFDNYLTSLIQRLKENKNEVSLFTLREMHIIPCTGCWGCWVRTPGECIFNDETIAIRNACINSGMIIFASPLIAGFTSALLKKVQDKMIPLLHPYFEIVCREFHHRKRYEKYPLIGLIYEKGDYDQEDVEITRDIYKRFALNFKSTLVFDFPITTRLKILSDEIDYY